MNCVEKIMLASFKLFLTNNYQKVTISMIESEAKVGRRTIYRHFTGKEDIFVKVCDHFIINAQDIKEKIQSKGEALSLHDFILNYVAAINQTMIRMYALSIVNIYKHYFSLISQANLYYPNFRDRISILNRNEYEMWENVLSRAIKSKEIRKDLDVKMTALQFRCLFLGMSFEQSLIYGLDPDLLLKAYLNIYNQIKL